MRSFIDRLVPRTDDIEAYHQGTLLVLACVLTGLFAAGYALLDLFAGFWVGGATMSVMTVLFFGLAPLFRHTGSVSLVAHLFLGIGTVTIVANAHFAGGPEVLAWLAAVPIAAVLVTNPRAAAVWVAVSVAVAALFASLEARGYAYPIATTPAEDPVWVVLVRAGLPLIVFALARVFHRERERALGGIRARNGDLQDALDRLGRTQARLVQHEKLAALGQVTAGIAHEIKNPLNFVTNFSALNGDLADDLEAALDDPEAAREILAEIRANAARVHAHGERADAIVRSMLAMARKEGGPRRRVALNALVAEAVAAAASGSGPRPAVDVEENYDGLVGTADVAPEEVARAVRNVVGNALDAARAAAPRLDGPPRVRVETAAGDGRVAIRVRDNGPGMAADVRDRVFEPFFTTKPSGEGTGLGLALAYDIVVARHGGSISVESAEREGTMVTLWLPAPTRPRGEDDVNGHGRLGRRSCSTS